MKCTEAELRATRSNLNNLVTSIAESNKVFDINQQLDNLEWLFGEFEKLGGNFVNEEPQTRGGWNIEAKKAAEKKDQSDEVIYARVVIAKNGLSLLQKAIPVIKQISDRCLEIAGKDAVRLACTPIKMEGTDWQGKPYAQPASEFTLPEGYGSITLKVKSLVGL